MPDEFDVFLSHNRRDQPVVEQIGAKLRARGLRVWLDKWELRPGFPWQEGLEEGVRTSRAVAVFVGADGLGAWQEPEMRAFIARSRREEIIPVLLPGCPDSPQLTLFLEAYTWVDLRAGLAEDGIARLAWGITGVKRGDMEAFAEPGRDAADLPHSAKAQKVRSRWRTGLSILLLVLPFVRFFWAHVVVPLRSHSKPAVPETWLRGCVVDGHRRGLPGVRVFPIDGTPGEAITDAEGRFALKFSVMPETRVRLRAEHAGSAGDDFCYAGRDSCAITLEAR